MMIVSAKHSCQAPRFFPRSCFGSPSFFIVAPGRVDRFLHRCGQRRTKTTRQNHYRKGTDDYPQLGYGGVLRFLGRSSVIAVSNTMFLAAFPSVLAVLAALHEPGGSRVVGRSESTGSFA